MRPGEKLADRKEAFAASGRSNNQKVAKLRAGLHGPHPQDVLQAAYSKKKACVLLGTRLEKVCKLVNAGEAGVVEFMLSGKKTASLLKMMSSLRSHLSMR